MNICFYSLLDSRSSGLFSAHVGGFRDSPRPPQQSQQTKGGMSHLKTELCFCCLEMNCNVYKFMELKAPVVDFYFFVSATVI